MSAESTRQDEIIEMVRSLRRRWKSESFIEDKRSFLNFIFAQVRLRGEVHRLVAPRDQKYQSNFVEVCW